MSKTQIDRRYPHSHPSGDAYVEKYHAEMARREAAKTTMTHHWSAAGNLDKTSCGLVIDEIFTPDETVGVTMGL